MPNGNHVRVNPEDVERFANNLVRVESEITTQFASLIRDFSNLSQTWQDSQNAQFAQTFKETTQKLKQFSNEAREIAPKLKSYVSKLRDAQNVRF